MKLKNTTDNDKSSRTRNRFAVVAVMAAGLSIMPCCATTGTSQSPAASESGGAPAAAALSKRSGLSAERQMDVANALRSRRTSAADLAAGDSGYQRLLASRVLEAGRRAGLEEREIARICFVAERQQVSVGSPLRGGVFDNASVPFRVTAIDGAGIGIEGLGRLEYGEPRIMGEFILQTLSVAEPGPNGTATILTISPSASQYKTSGPAQR